MLKFLTREFSFKEMFIPADIDLCRRLSEEEYDDLVDYAIDLGITNGFIQESGTVSPSYIPVFDGTGIIKNSFS